MISTSISRRNFLKISLLAIGSLAAGPRPRILPEIETLAGIGRVATQAVNVYQEPDFSSERVAKIKRDTLLDLIEETRSPHGPARNPRWYRVTEGYIHSGHIQRVERQHFNEIPDTLPEEKNLGEITVAYTQALRKSRDGNWFPGYRLYYRSNHWVTGIVDGPDGLPWYKIKDERLLAHYYVPAGHVKLYPPDIYRPIFPDVPLKEKRIIVTISEQRLRAYQGDELLREMSISSGLPDQNLKPTDVPTATPTGSFHVSVKWPVRHMGNGYLTADPEAYELPGVPWSMFFHESGYALHGAYWHDNFGYRMSHGCINMRPENASWIFRWTDPVYKPGNWYTRGTGTLVLIKD
jgi:hypothetical protein